MIRVVCYIVQCAFVFKYYHKIYGLYLLVIWNVFMKAISALQSTISVGMPSVYLCL